MATREEVERKHGIDLVTKVRNKANEGDFTATKQLAEWDLPVSQFVLGEKYLHGEGIGKDENEAFKWFMKAAAQGFADAYFAVGICYANGKGVERDTFVAIDWLKKAQAAGVPEAAQYIQRLMG